LRIAITGSSSTGKTTLVKALLKHDQFNLKIKSFLNVDARSLLGKMGFQSMDLMNREQLKIFQLEYFKNKREVELGNDDYITDRSFVDVAAYWKQRDTLDQPTIEQDRLIAPCREEASKYNLHIYLPFGLFKFESDGYRSDDNDLHNRIDAQIKLYLKCWELRYITLNTADIQERVEISLRAIEAL